MTDEQVRSNETVVPMLHCVSPEETLAFWSALGFTVTYEQTKPYLYLAFRWSGFDLNYNGAPDGVDPSAERTGGCVVMVDAVAPYHATFSEAMRRAYGRVLVKGQPRMTRYRPGTSRFTVIDPSGNSITFIQRDEPAELEYGGSKRLHGLARALDNARILREFKNDDRAAFRALTLGLSRHGEAAPAVERAQVLAALIELADLLAERQRVPEWGARLRALPLTAEEREQVRLDVADPAVLAPWLPKAEA
ncbi:glyoxalase [Micromonospora tulbaghiae]|uniref:glyoxalase n=1 Tax=Micromonospora tulbaghiae TaxID=479978 RepID=UPI0033E7E093